MISTIVLTLLFAVTSAAADTPVARIGHRVIMYSEIACNPEVAAKQKKSCLQSEQLALDAKVVLARADEMCRLNHIEVSQTEIEAASSRSVDDAVPLFRAIGLASLALMDGRSRATVDAEILKPAGVPPELFESVYRRLKSREAVQKFMKAHERSELLKRARSAVDPNALKRSKLHSVAEMRAVQLHQPESAVVQQMLDQATASLGGIEILDPRFHMPKIIGVMP